MAEEKGEDRMQPAFVMAENGRVLGTHSWVDGFKPIKRPARRLTEAEAQAHALWLENYVSTEAGLEFIEAWYLGYAALFTVK